MIHSSDERYTGDAYLKSNPQWNLEDASWKAEHIKQLLEKNKISPRSIVDLGCGAGGILKELRKYFHKNVTLTGYDISSAAIRLATKEDPGNIIFIVGDYLETENDYSELLLLIDVLEHVDDYYGFLRRMKRKGKNFVFHIPLDLSARSVVRPHIIKQQRDSVGHIHYFSLDMVFWLLRDTGSEIIDWHYTKPVSDLQKSPTLWRAIKRRLRNFSFAMMPSLSAKLWGEYSVMVLAK